MNTTLTTITKNQGIYGSDLVKYSDFVLCRDCIRGPKFTHAMFTMNATTFEDCPFLFFEMIATTIEDYPFLFFELIYCRHVYQG
jgi:hypothetical protein